MALFDSPPRELQNFFKANQTFGQTDRYRAATKAEMYYWSLQYEGMLDWNASGPLRKKKPRVLVPLYATAINTLERFIWGGNRFPKVMVASTRGENDQPDSDEIGPRLFPDDATTLTNFVNSIIQVGELDAAIREASTMATITTSAAIILGTRGGYLVAHAEPGKHCTPTFDPLNPRKVSKLEIMYQYETEEPNGSAGLIRRMYWYRRTIDTEMDTVYKPIEIKQSMMDPEWVVDKERTVEHKLGFCPVTWLRSLPASTDAIDGRPVIDPALYNLLDRFNYAVSQRDRAVEYFQDPQWIRKNVPIKDRHNLAKNPGMMWDLPEDAQVEIMEAKGSGQETAAKHIQDLKEAFFEAVGVVLTDPNRLRASSHISGTVLEYLHTPMMGLASDLRNDFGKAFKDLLNNAMRLCAIVSGRGEDIWIQNVNNASKTLMKSQLRGVWLDVPINLFWGTYFSPTVQEQQLKVASANQALIGGLVSKNSATSYVADIFSVFDVDNERQIADKETEERVQQGLDTQQTQVAGGKSIGSPSPTKALGNQQQRNPGKG